MLYFYVNTVGGTAETMEYVTSWVQVDSKWVDFSCTVTDAQANFNICQNKIG